MKLLFHYLLGTLPLSVAAANGTPKKSQKSDLIHKLEEKTEWPGMSQANETRNRDTYLEFATNLLKFNYGLSNSSSQIDVVVRKYVQNSINDVERNERFQGDLSTDI